MSIVWLSDVIENCALWAPLFAASCALHGDHIYLIPERYNGHKLMEINSSEMLDFIKKFRFYLTLQNKVILGNLAIYNMDKNLLKRPIKNLRRR